MFRKSCVALLGLCLVCVARAANVYVVPPGTPGVVPDGAYQTWETAATNIQDAIDAIDTASGNVIYITNGTYLLPDQLNVNKDVVLRSYKNGMTSPADTILDGNNYEGKPVTNRVISVNHAGAEIDGFTVTGGQLVEAPLSGGGILVTAVGLITNCVIRDNSVTFDTHAAYGGGLRFAGPGLITHCAIVSNSAKQGGGISFAKSASGIIEYCDISWNIAEETRAGYGGGGAHASPNSRNALMRHCRIAHNIGRGNGGGLLLYSGHTQVENCAIISNTQTHGTSGRSGGGVFFQAAADGYLRNCLIACNTNFLNRDAVGVSPASFTFVTLENCVVANNGDYGINLTNCVVVNTIIYGNRMDDVRVINDDTIFNNCLSSIALPGTDNLVGDPLFIDTDFRLAPHSPGINAGMELDWMLEPGARDLDGQRRIDRVFKQVDIGCYEFLPQITFFRLH